MLPAKDRERNQNRAYFLDTHRKLSRQQKRAATLVATLVSFRPWKLVQRLLNWKLRRAFILPYFLRSTARESRVRKPAIFRMPRSSGS